MVSGALPLHPWTAPTCEINRRLTTTASAKPVANGLHPDAHLELFGIETCEACGGKVQVIASLEDPAVIGKILGHLAARELTVKSWSSARGPPEGEMGFL